MSKITQILLLIVILVLTCQIDAGNAAGDAIYKENFSLSFYPSYPPLIGQTITLRVQTFIPVLKVTLYSDREQRIPMVLKDGAWWGRFTIPKDYQEGSHYFTVWLRHVAFKPQAIHTYCSNKKVWYKAFREKPRKYIPLPPEISLEAKEEIPLPVTGEAIEVTVASPETTPLLIKGSQSITFKTRSLEGSKEGYTSGTSQTREESLRINVSGRAAETDIEATLYRTSAVGVAQVGEHDEEISILMRRGSTEVYLGDFTADLTETEFSRLDKVLSGGRIRGDYDKWGFTALYSSPKGEAETLRRYGDGTQGPYALGNSPVVINSERVLLDGVLQKRGDDYTIDYQAGTITFIKQIIDAQSIIQVNYDYRQTLYQHETSGLRVFYKPSDNLRVGATYLNDSDSLSGAEEIRGSISGEAVNPQSHYVLGADGSYVTENIVANLELAYSAKNLDLLSASGTNETGRAGKLNVSSNLGPVGLTAFVKKVGSNFQSIADPDPKQDVWEYGGELSYRPGSLFGSKGDYAYQKYTQSGIIYENIYKTAKAMLTPDDLPSLEYNFSETDESNDPVTGSSIRRIITKNSVETIHQVGVFSTSVKGTLEKWLNRSPSEEVTDYQKINFGLATIGLEKITFSSNVELENRREPTGLEPYRRTYNLNLSASPSQQFFVSSALQLVDDSAQGQTNVTDLAYKYQPSKMFKTDGKYTITSVDEEFPTTSEAVSKQVGAFSFDFRPSKQLRLRYLFKPNFTQIRRTQTLSYNNEQQQAEINILPVKYALLGMIYKLGKSFQVNKDDYPNYTARESSEDSNSTLYTIKMAPIQILSTEFNYQRADSFTNTLNSTSEPYSYTPGTNQSGKFDAIIKTSLSEKFSIDSRYAFERTNQGTNESSGNLANTKTYTASLKGIWNLSEKWTFSLSGAYSRVTDYLLSSVTYTFSPGFGAIYRLGDRLRIDFDYVHSQSYAGATTVKDNYSLKTKYALSDFIDVTFRADQEISRAPDYRLTDITGNVEINL